MAKKIQIIFTEEQMNNVVHCMDMTLKQEGLNALNMITDLHNVLISGKVLEDEEPKKNEEKNKERK